MAFNNNPNHIDDHTFHPMEATPVLKDDDSPQQQINVQSITQNLEKTRECKQKKTRHTWLTDFSSLVFIYLRIALKRKLQTRRSLKQLVDVGIMPSRKAPLPYYEQCKQLQMRKVRVER